MYIFLLYYNRCFYFYPDELTDEVIEKMTELNIQVKLTDGVKNFLVEKGYDPVLGARPIQRMIDSEIAEKLAKEMLFGRLSGGGKVKIVVENDELSFDLLV